MSRAIAGIERADEVKDLRGFGNEERQSPFGIEEPDLEGRSARSSAGFSPRRMKGGEVGWRGGEVDLGRRCAAESFLRAQVGVVEEPKLESPTKVANDKRPESAQAQHVLQRPPEPLDERDGPCLADGAEALAHAKALERFAEGDRGELSALIGDEVTGLAVHGGGLRKSLPIAAEVGSARKILAASGIREKASKTTASLKERIRKRLGISVRSAIQTWFG